MKKLFSVILTLSLALSLAACGNSGELSSSSSAKDNDSSTAADGSSAADTESSGAEEDEPSVAPGKKGTLEFWTVFTGADGTSMQAMVDAYNATDPDYTVNHRAIEANDLYLKMPLAVQSKQDVPDIAINHIERIRAFKDSDFLTDITPYLEDAGVKAENYNEKAWKMSDLDDGHYGVPLDVHTYVLYTNMDLYEEYGAGELDDGILTWDEVYAAGERLKDTDIIPMGMGWLRVKFLASYAQLGGTLSADGTTPDFNNPEAHKVLQNWIDLEAAGYTNKEGDQPWEMFLGGSMLFCPEGQWMYNNIKEAGMNVQMDDYPVFDADVKGNWTSSHQFVFPKSDSRDEEMTIAALQFIDYIGNNSIEWARAGQTPAHVSIKDNAEFKEMPQAFLADENEELKIYDYKYYGYAVEALDKVLPEMWWGRISLDDGFNQAVQETKDKIELEG